MLNPALFPLAAISTALLAWFALAPFKPAGMDLGSALAAAMGAPWGEGLGLGLALGMPLGFLWQGVFWPRSAPARSTAGLGVMLALCLLAFALQAGQAFYLHGYAPPGGPGGQMLGFALGVLLWWLAGPALLARLQRLRGPWWPALVLAVVLVAVLPLELDTPAGALVMPEAWPWDVPQRVYGLIKTSILWVPLGFLFVLAGKGAFVPRVGLALPLGLVLLGWPYLGGMPWREVLELVFALPGLWLGAWLGEGTAAGVRPREPLQAKVRGTVPTAPPAAAVSGDSAEARRLAPVRAGSAPLPQGEGEMAREEVAAVPARTPERPRRHRKHAHAGRAADGDEGLAPGGLARRGLGLLVLALALSVLLDFPRWPLAMGLGLAVYAGVLWRWPTAWLVVVPAALPLLDLAPWTGRYFLDEFDLLMLATAGVLLLKGGRPARASYLPGARLLLGLLGVALMASMLIGAWPWPALDANATASYWSPYNALRVAKGFLWAGLIFLWFQPAPDERQAHAQRLALGMGLGLLGVGLAGAWEHHLFVGFQGEFEWYRIVGTFSSMHTGGGHIEAYLVAALPFLWLATSKFRHLAFTAPVMLLTAYVMLYTVARGGVLALGVVLVILLVASVRLALRSRGRRFVAPVAVLVGVGLVLAGGAGVGYFQQRFAQTGLDWQTRVDHWGQALGMMDGTVGAQLVGMGLGSFPRVYQERGPAHKQPASFGFATDQGNTHFRLGTGETVYYAQRIPFSAGKSYRLELELRSRQGDTRLDTPVCEKQLLNSRQCEWFSFNVPGDGAWHRLSHVFSSAKVGAEGWLNRPPVELFLYHPGKGGVVDVDNLRLLDPDGRDVLCNGDFSQGGDCWFFKTHSHLPWHIKNVWVHVLFEQGWVGLLLFTTLAGLALYRLARAGWRGHRLAWAWLASLAGLLVVGMFDSLLDAPRLATLLMAWTLLGAGYDWEPRGRSHKRTGMALRRRPEA